MPKFKVNINIPPFETEVEANSKAEAKEMGGEAFVEHLGSDPDKFIAVEEIGITPQ